jgi:hypothetical protein
MHHFDALPHFEKKDCCYVRKNATFVLMGFPFLFAYLRLGGLFCCSHAHLRYKKFQMLWLCLIQVIPSFFLNVLFKLFLHYSSGIDILKSAFCSLADTVLVSLLVLYGEQCYFTSFSKRAI